MVRKIIYKDRFLGEIELTKIGQTPMNAFGESIVKTVYVDKNNNYYIDTWITTGSEPSPMLFLDKDLVTILVEHKIKLG